MLVFSLYCGHVCAIGERLVEAVMTSDFVFDRNISNVPFFPIGYLTLSQQNSLDIDEGCELESCEFDYQSMSQGFGLPVWVGEKNMLILGESLQRDRLSWQGDNIQIDSAGVLLAWMAQPSESWQAGAFVYAYRGLGDDKLAREPKGSIGGVVVRHRHQARFHSYWGAVRFEEYSNVTIYPYIGFDWYIGEKWSVSAVLPWPTVSYAPNDDQLFKLGALFSGSEWVVDRDGEIITNDFEKWDIGFAYEHRLFSMFWAEIGIGYSGFGKLAIRSDSDIELDINTSDAPFIRLTFNIRPE